MSAEEVVPASTEDLERYVIIEFLYFYNELDK